LPPVQLARFADAASLRGAYGGERYGRAALARVPPGALVVTSYFETYFTLVALQRTAGERPDVTVVDRNLLSHPYAPAASARLHPGLDLRAELARPDRPVFVELAANLDPDP